MKSNSNIGRVGMFSCLLVLALTSGYAQVHQDWVARYNGPGNSTDSGVDLAIDSAGNVYVTGSSNSATTGTDYATIKYTSSGVQQWISRYEGPGSSGDGPRAIAVDNSGNVCVTGISGNNNRSDFATVKYDSSGVQQWVARYGNQNMFLNFSRSIAIDNSGNVFVTGYSLDSTTNTASDWATIKYTASGSQQWATRYHGGFGSDDAVAITVDNAGNAYVTGWSYGGSTGNNIVTIKYSSLGSVVWVSRDTSSRQSYARSICLDNIGNVYVAGEAIDSTGRDYFTIKYNLSGVKQWAARYDGPGNNEDQLRSLAVDSAGNAYVTGSSSASPLALPDYTTIKYNSSGVRQWVANYGGPGSDAAYDLVVDPSGNVYVTGASAGSGPTNGDYATVKYNPSGLQQWVARYDGPANGPDNGNDIELDRFGGLYVTGGSNGGSSTGLDFATIKYSQGLFITSPQAGERWIAGEQDTIRLVGRALGTFVAVDYSTDSGSTYTNITTSLLADSLIWQIPSGLLTTRAKIRVRTTSAPLDTAVSDTFKIKGYVLTRMNAIGHYDPFLPTDDGWSFANLPSNFWPNQWWGQFQYSGGIDRHTGAPFDPAFPASPVFALPNHFVDWPSFVDVFGRSECFWFFSNTYRDNSVERWGRTKTSWNGSCFGVAQSALLYFHYRDQFRERHPSVLLTDRLASILVMTDSIRQINTRYFAMQFGRLKQDHDAANAGTTPRQTLQLIRQMWSNDNPDDDAGLRYRDPAGSGGHAVIPYQLQRSTTNLNQFQLSVCNSNNPQSVVDFILIDSLANTWQEFTGFGWAQGTTLMHLYPPAVGFFSSTIFPFGPSSDLREGGGRIEIWSPQRSDLRILSSAGDSIGVRNGREFNGLPDALALSLDTGHPQPPLGYDIPAGDYRMRVTNPVDSNITVSVVHDSLSMTYSRTGSTSGERDELWYDGQLGVKNPDVTQKTVSLQMLAAGTSRDLTANITDLVIAQNDSVASGMDGQARPKLVNFGPAKSYHLTLRNSSAEGLHRFESATLNVPAQSSHIIDPRWDSLATSTARIYVDIGNNGTIDDTIFVNNTVDVDDRGSLEMPTEYNLAQNYPNPFNPSTTIKFDVPQLSQVTLRIFDILGREVATLVSEQKTPGRYEVEWNTEGASSGVYLYRLEAGSYVETRKMVLLR